MALSHPRVFFSGPHLESDCTVHHRFVPLLALLPLLLSLCPGCGPSVRSHRPLPPSSAVPNTIRFVDVAQAAGLHYRWTIAGKRPFNILQTIGNGCAFLDYNNDGSLGILLVGPKPALYRGDGQGHFTDVTHAMGLDKLHGNFLGCAVGDYDNDGYDDIYLSGYRTGLLLHNEHGTGFKDVTKAAGLKPQPWGTSAAFGDIDGDGRLDLYVANYVAFGPQTEPQLCTVKTPHGLVKTSCGPESYPALKGVLYRNLDGKRFRDVTQEWGLGAQSGKGMGAAMADYAGRGRLGLAVANDEMPGDLFQNGGNGRLKNVGRSSGTAFGAGGVAHGGMGLDWGDYDNDGRLDLFVATYNAEPKDLYRNDGSGLFTDQAHDTGMIRTSRDKVAFGCKFFDADNDGWLDLIVSNGHTADNIDEFWMLKGFTTYRQPTQLFHNLGGIGNVGRFGDISERAGADFGRPILGRGLAVGDYDNDGRVDALVVDSEGMPLLLRNETQGAGHWLSFTLVGTRSNRDGYGASVTVTAGGRTQTRLCHADGSYLSSSDKRVHVGLGAAAQADTVQVYWPSGHRDTFHNLPADTPYRIEEGDPEAHPPWRPGTPQAGHPVY